MKKKFLFSCLLLGSFFITRAQTMNLIWAKKTGGASYDIGNALVTDAAGNVYTTGFFSGTSDFDPGTGTFNLTSNGSYDIIVSKLDASGNFVWAKQVGSTSLDIATSIAVDAAGNVYTAGYFQGIADFDPGAGTFNLTPGSIGSPDNFILKLDGAGNFVWAKRTGNSGGENTNGIAVDAVGNIYTTGYFAGTVDFDPEAGTSNLTSAGAADIFVSKLDATGNFLWAKRMGGVDADIGYGVAVDATGNVYTTGSFSNTADFDPGAGTANLSGAGGFVSKLDPTGTFIWAKRLGAGGTYSYAIEVDATGNVYTTGGFQATGDFDPGAGTANLTSAGSWEAFVSKLDAAGNYVWANSLGSTGFDTGNAITVDAVGNVYTTGNFSGTVDFDPGTGVSNFVSAGNGDIYIWQLGASGNFIRAYQMTGAGNDEGNGITIDAFGNVYTAGTFESTVDFDPATRVLNLSSAGIGDIFIHKLGTAAVALNFDGSNDRVSLGSFGISGAAARTVEFWIKTTVTGGFQNPFSSGTANPNAAFNIKVTPTGHLGLMGFGNDYYPSTGTLIADGSFHHVAVTYDGTNAIAYIDGTWEWTFATILATAGSDNFIGSSNHTGAEQYFKGTIDELRVWNEARDGCEILTYKNCEISGAAAGLVANYHFNQGAHNSINTGLTALVDSSGSSNTGTLANFALTGSTSNWTSPGAVALHYTTPLVSTVSSTGTSTNVSCFGGSNGTASVSPVGGVSPYTYSWVPAGGTGAGASGLTAGNYTVTVRDATGCTSRAYTIIQPTAVSGATAVTNTTCFGGSNGTIDLTPSGGTPGYTYNWGSGITTQDRTGLAAGTYTVIIRDASACTGTVTATVNQPAAVSGTTVVTNTTCFGGSNGTIDLTPSGGTPGYTYNWGGGITTQDRTGLVAGTYTVIIRDANACTGTVTATITAPPALVLTAAAQTNVSCFGGSNGAASMNAANGGTGTKTYDWAPGTPTGDGTTSVSGLTAGTWTCTVTDANGCTASQVFTVSEPSAVSFTASSQTNVSCFGGSDGASAMNAATGGTGTKTYDWAPGTPTGDGTTSVSGLTAGTWTCTVTDANGCTASQVFTVSEPGELVLTAASQTNVSCFGGSNGDAGVNAATGGTGTKTYDWAPGTPTGDGTISASNLTAGTWTCTVTDANGCTASQVFTVSEPSAVSFTASSQTNVSCFGGSDGAAVMNAATGGTGTKTYDWAPGTPTGDGTTSASGLTEGTWTCTVTDANGCTASQVFTVSEPGASVSTVTATSCDAYTLNSTTYTSDGTYTQILTGASSTGCDSTITLSLTIRHSSASTMNATACSSYTLNGTTYNTNGTYTQMFTNAAGCDSTLTLNLTVNQPSTSTLNETTCVSYTLNGTTYTASGTYTQNLTNAAGCDSTLTLNLIVNQPSVSTLNETTCVSYTLNGTTYTASGTYTQNLTNAAGCDSTLTLNLTVNQPSVSTLNETTCVSYTLNGTTYNASGTYTQNVTNVSGCDSTITLNLTINNVDVSVTQNGETITANASGAAYQWMDCTTNLPVSGETNQSFTATANGDYAVIVTNSGCSDTSLCTNIAGIGMKDIKTELNQVTVFPNPFSNMITVSATVMQSATIEICNAIGEKVYITEMKGTTMNIDLNKLENGVYILKLTNGNILSTKRIVKQQ
ncbi:MAG: gliding motility-related protein [Bacteroidetes bacterium]|jgi:hypothetical protein|nr:gliding motility-related protein [Bacteroidota bacterium]